MSEQQSHLGELHLQGGGAHSHSASGDQLRPGRPQATSPHLLEQLLLQGGPVCR